MSAARSSGRRPVESRGAPQRPREITHLQARRRAANRRRRLLRLDIGVGVFVAIVLLIATPGLAIAGILGIVMLAVCVGSVLVERRRRRKRAEAQRGSSTKTAMSREVRSL
jgi:Flp pilus assembly protein TadB